MKFVNVSINTRNQLFKIVKIENILGISTAFSQTQNDFQL